MPSAHFGFRNDLFRSTADPAFFVAHSSMKEVVGSLLFSQLSQRKGLTLITGESGVGKTALLSRMLEQNQAEDGGVYLSCGENWSFDTLMDHWSDELGIGDQVTAREARSSAVVDFLSARSQQGNPASTLLLDHAENLTDDALEGLSEFSKAESGGTSLVQAILAARPEISIRLDHPKLEKVARGIVFRARLEPIKESEVGDYIRHRLQIAGYEGPLPFSDDAVATVADASRGIAAHVNLLCHTALQLTELEREKSVTAAFAERAVELCAKRLSDGTDSPTDEVGGDSGQRAEQDSLAGRTPLVDLALRKPSRKIDDTWPMPLDMEQVDAVPLEGGPVVPAEAPPSAPTQPAIWKAWRPRGGPWPAAALVAVVLTTGLGIAWYRMPADSTARERPDTIERLAIAQGGTNPVSGGPPVKQSLNAPPQSAQTLKAPRLAVTAAEGYEDQAIALEIALLGVDRYVTPRPTLTLSGLPPGTTLSAGHRVADGTWRLEGDDLPGLTLAAPVDYSGSFTGEVAARLGGSNDDDSLATAPLAVKVASVADTPFLGAADATGKQDQPIPLHAMAGLSDLDGSEELAVSLAGLPEGSRLSAGKAGAAGDWILAAKELLGLRLLPPANIDGSFQVMAQATAWESSGAKASLSAPFNVFISAAPETLEALEKSVEKKLEASYLPAPDLTESDIAAPSVFKSGLVTRRRNPLEVDLIERGRGR